MVPRRGLQSDLATGVTTARSSRCPQVLLVLGLWRATRLASVGTPKGLHAAPRAHASFSPAGRVRNAPKHRGPLDGPLGRARAVRDAPRPRRRKPASALAAVGPCGSLASSPPPRTSPLSFVVLGRRRVGLRADNSCCSRSSFATMRHRWCPAQTRQSMPAAGPVGTSVRGASVGAVGSTSSGGTSGGKATTTGMAVTSSAAETSTRRPTRQDWPPRRPRQTRRRAPRGLPPLATPAIQARTTAGLGECDPNQDGLSGSIRISRVEEDYRALDVDASCDVESREPTRTIVEVSCPSENVSLELYTNPPDTLAPEFAVGERSRYEHFAMGSSTASRRRMSPSATPKGTSSRPTATTVPCQSSWIQTTSTGLSTHAPAGTSFEVSSSPTASTSFSSPGPEVAYLAHSSCVRRRP